MDWTQHHGNAFKNVRVLVTGGAGFIGSHLVEALVQLGAKVVAMDDLCGGDWANLHGFADHVQRTNASILDSDALSKAVAGCRYVFHEAALGSVPRSVKEPVLYHQVNVIGTLNVLEAARRAGVQRVIYAGSSSAYGNLPVADPDAPKHEDMTPAPLSPYAMTKLAGEYDCRVWSHTYNLDTVTLRYFNIFGPRQNANSAYAAVIAAFAKALLNGQPPVIFGDGTQSRDFTFVDNAVHANLLAARYAEPLKGEVFNVGCGQRASVNELLSIMAHLAGVDGVKARHAEPRPGDVKHSLADVAKAARRLGYKPLVDLETGLAATIEWYRRNLTPAK